MGEREEPGRVEVLANTTAAGVFGGVPPHVRGNGGMRGLGRESSPLARENIKLNGIGTRRRTRVKKSVQNS